MVADVIVPFSCATCQSSSRGLASRDSGKAAGRDGRVSAEEKKTEKKVKSLARLDLETARN